MATQPRSLAFRRRSSEAELVQRRNPVAPAGPEAGDLKRSALHFTSLFQRHVASPADRNVIPLAEKMNAGPPKRLLHCPHARDGAS
jgi:hypothetical protein